MRLLVEIFIIGALISLGWEKPFKQWIDQTVNASAAATPSPAPVVAATPPPVATPAPAVPIVAATPRPYVTPPGSWMFDPNHKAPLDPPVRKSKP